MSAALQVWKRASVPKRASIACFRLSLVKLPPSSSIICITSWPWIEFDIITSVLSLRCIIKAHFRRWRNRKAISRSEDDGPAERTNRGGQNGYGADRLPTGHRDPDVSSGKKLHRGV